MSNFTTREVAELVEMLEFLQRRFGKSLEEALIEVVKHAPHIIEEFIKEHR
jgi:hypothetical protein